MKIKHGWLYFMRLFVFLVFIFIISPAYANYQSQEGRFMQRDPLGGNPAGGKLNPYVPLKQYIDGLNLYKAFAANPASNSDYLGLYYLYSQSWPVNKDRRDRSILWTANYDVEFFSTFCVMLFSMDINLIPRNVSLGDIDSLSYEWQDAIHSQFNNWRLVSDKCNCQCKNGIKLQFLVRFYVNSNRGIIGPVHNSIRINQEYAPSTPSIWFLGDQKFGSAPYNGVVHEIGHMYGLADEYISEGSDPDKIIPDDAEDSIMYNADKGQILQRHIEDIVNISGVQRRFSKCDFKVTGR